MTSSMACRKGTPCNRTHLEFPLMMILRKFGYSTQSQNVVRVHCSITNHFARWTFSPANTEIFLVFGIKVSTGFDLVRWIDALSVICKRILVRVSRPKLTIPVASAMTALSLGLRASNSSMTRGKPPNYSQSSQLSCGAFAIILQFNLAPASTKHFAPAGKRNSQVPFHRSDTCTISRRSIRVGSRGAFPYLLLDVRNQVSHSDRQSVSSICLGAHRAILLPCREQCTILLFGYDQVVMGYPLRNNLPATALSPFVCGQSGTVGHRVALAFYSPFVKNHDFAGA